MTCKRFKQDSADQNPLSSHDSLTQIS